MINQDTIIALINADNPIDIPHTSESITLSLPVVDIGESWNTKLTVSSVDGYGYFGDVDVFYHRIELAELGPINLLSETPFTRETIVALLNSRKGTELDVSDVVDLFVPDMALGETGTVVLAAQADSLGWTAEAEIALLFGLPENVDLLHQLVTVTFPASGYFSNQ